LLSETEDSLTSMNLGCPRQDSSLRPSAAEAATNGPRRSIDVSPACGRDSWILALTSGFSRTHAQQSRAVCGGLVSEFRM